MSCPPPLVSPLLQLGARLCRVHTVCQQALAHVGLPAQRTFPTFVTCSFRSAFEFSSGLFSLWTFSLKAPLCVPCPCVFSDQPVLPCLPVFTALSAIVFSSSNPSLNHKLFKDRPDPYSLLYTQHLRVPGLQQGLK